MNVFLINFYGFTRLRYFTKCTLIVIKTIAKIGYIACYILFRTRAPVKFINSKIYIAMYNPFTNIVFIPISVLKLTCVLNILTNLEMFTITSSTFRFLGVYVINYISYQIIHRSASFTLNNHGRRFSRNSFEFQIRRKKHLCFI